MQLDQIESMSHSVRADEVVKPSTVSDKCHFWIISKLRFCSVKITNPLLQYCGQHSLVGRVPCPYTSSHDILATRLHKHLHKCVFKSIAQPDYYSKDYNQGIPAIQITGDHDRMVNKCRNEFSSHRQIIDLISSKSMKDYSDFEIDVKSHDVLLDKVSACEIGKNAIQQASLLGHLNDSKLLSVKFTFVEFGCGKAELTKYVQIAVPRPAHTVLIDRKKAKLKLDKDFKQTSWQRVIIDIKDLNLHNLLAETNPNSNRSCVAYSKHLCGSATDLSLRCLSNYRKCGGRVAGIVIALCCHQLCNFEQYVNKEYLSVIGASKDVFEMICYFTSWAVSGESHINVPYLFYKDISHWTGLSAAERREFGYKCKRIIDIGRLRYLEKAGASCKLRYYVTRQCSPENLALVCTWDHAD